MHSSPRLASDSEKYFNLPLLAWGRKGAANLQPDWNDFMLRMEKERILPNGAFDMKAHPSQMLVVSGTKTPNPQMATTLKSFDHLIWSRRRDRLAQLISHAIAENTQTWSLQDAEFAKSRAANIHSSSDICVLNIASEADFGWDRLLLTVGLSVHEFWHEDLFAGYETDIRAVLKHLELNGKVAGVAPPIEREATDLNEGLLTSVFVCCRVNGGRH